MQCALFDPNSSFLHYTQMLHKKKFNIQIKYCHGLALTQFQRASPKTQNKVDAINYGLILRIKGFNPFQTVQVFSICLQLTIQCDWLCSYTSSTLVAGGTSLKKGISLLLISFIISWSPENCSNFRMQKVLHRSMSDKEFAPKMSFSPVGCRNDWNDL